MNPTRILVVRGDDGSLAGPPAHVIRPDVRASLLAPRQQRDERERLRVVDRRHSEHGWLRDGFRAEDVLEAGDPFRFAAPRSIFTRTFPLRPNSESSSTMT